MYKRMADLKKKVESPIMKEAKSLMEQLQCSEYVAEMDETSEVLDKGGDKLPTVYITFKADAEVEEHDLFDSVEELIAARIFIKWVGDRKKKANIKSKPTTLLAIKQFDNGTLAVKVIQAKASDV